MIQGSVTYSHRPIAARSHAMTEPTCQSCLEGTLLPALESQTLSPPPPPFLLPALAFAALLALAAAVLPSPPPLLLPPPTEGIITAVPALLYADLRQAARANLASSHAEA